MEVALSLTPTSINARKVVSLLTLASRQVMEVALSLTLTSIAECVF